LSLQTKSKTIGLDHTSMLL